MFAPASSPTINCDIRDIRKDVDGIEVGEEVIKGLLSDPPHLPEALLWNDTGLELFDRFSQTPSYYPYHSEIEILNEHASKIAESVTTGGAIIELGCGTIRKTKTILSVFDREQRPVQYYALDISRKGLTESIVNLTEALINSKLFTITGLLGTYEDCILWLSKPENVSGLSSITFLWLGNSIANFHNHTEASAFLNRMKHACQSSDVHCKFILSTDICDQISRMDDAYNLDKPELQEWISNGLNHVNTALGMSTLLREDWRIVTEYVVEESSLNTYYVALRDVGLQLTVVGDPLTVIRKGTKIPIIKSGKWGEKIMGAIARDAGFIIQQRWKDGSGMYCVYLLDLVV